MKQLTTNPENPLEVITSKGDKFIQPLRILFLKAKGKHTLIYFTDMHCLETHHLIKWYEELLQNYNFCRCHNSYIVNCLYIDCTCGNNAVLTCNGISIPIARNRKQHYKDCVEISKQTQNLQTDWVNIDPVENGIVKLNKFLNIPYYPKVNKNAFANMKMVNRSGGGS
jgi:hypothetical protein